MQNKPILIVGAGPTGLTLANLLAKIDVPFLIIDKNPHPSRESKAFGIQARSLEVFDQLGIADKAVNAGSIDNKVHVLITDKEFETIRLKELLPGQSRYPYFLVLEQNKTEQLMVKRLQEYGQTVQWQHELVGLQDRDNLVEAAIKDPEMELQNMQFEYVVGCDGARSTVRNEIGLSFEGKTYSPTFYLADCEIDGNITHGQVYSMIAPYYLSVIFSFREKNRFRLFNFINTVINKEKGEMLTKEDVQKIVDSNPYQKVSIKKIEWSSVFKIHSRYTKEFMKGRVFLAGDAAHVHSPVGGQGMNTGIQDAYNLAWKLKLVLNRNADSALLRTYHEERYPIAKNLHNTTDRLFQFVIKKNKVADIARQYVVPRVLKYLFGIRAFRNRNVRRLSQLAIKYRYSRLSREGQTSGFTKKAPEPGDRAPYCKIIINGKETDIYSLFTFTNFTLLVAALPAESKAADDIFSHFSNNYPLPLIVHKISKGKDFFNTYGVKEKGIFLVRPDGHIGFRSSSLDINELENYFRNNY